MRHKSLSPETEARRGEVNEESKVREEVRLRERAAAVREMPIERNVMRKQARSRHAGKCSLMPGNVLDALNCFRNPACTQPGQVALSRIPAEPLTLLLFTTFF